MSSTSTRRGQSSLFAPMIAPAPRKTTPPDLRESSLHWHVYGLPDHELLVFTMDPDMKMHNGQQLKGRSDVTLDEAEWTRGMRLAFNQVGRCRDSFNTLVNQRLICLRSG